LLNSPIFYPLVPLPSTLLRLSLTVVGLSPLPPSSLLKRFRASVASSVFVINVVIQLTKLAVTSTQLRISPLPSLIARLNASHLDDKFLREPSKLSLFFFCCSSAVLVPVIDYVNLSALFAVLINVRAAATFSVPNFCVSCVVVKF